MKRNILRVLFSLLFVFTGILFCVCLAIPEIPYGIKETIVNTPTPDPLEFELTDAFSQYESGKIPFVDLSALTSFTWDRLYIFGPYTLYSELNSKIGISWMFVCSTDIDVLEETALLVFKRNGIVEHCLEYSILKYDFTSLASSYSDGIPIQEADFVINKDGLVDLASNR